ncbi:hypothetical protein [Halorubellus salinus]|uniref:hypothetical protein n=1 Tax=Halorubellus salinus TaxID=755309 RepID=UPI001D08FE8A|nr:hypothetical protein [Halorubellus salinus]
MIDHGRAVLALFVIAALIVGTAGYDSIQSERSADVNVANDADAYLALEETGTPIENGSTGPVLVVTNQFGTNVDISVTVESTSENVTSGSLTAEDLGPGKSVELQATCESNESGELIAEIEAQGDGIQFRTTTTLVVECVSSSN